MAEPLLRWCATCAQMVRPFVEQSEGNSAPKGTLCCPRCQRVFPTPDD